MRELISRRPERISVTFVNFHHIEFQTKKKKRKKNNILPHLTHAFSPPPCTCYVLDPLVPASKISLRSRFRIVSPFFFFKFCERDWRGIIDAGISGEKRSFGKRKNLEQGQTCNRVGISDILLVQGTRMEERLDDAINVLRNHAESQLGLHLGPVGPHGSIYSHTSPPQLDHLVRIFSLLSDRMEIIGDRFIFFSFLSLFPLHRRVLILRWQ